MSDIYGLDYDTAFLDSLPIAGSDPSSLSTSTVPVTSSTSSDAMETTSNAMPSRHTSSIRTLKAPQFKDFHRQHILSHPPDSVLFPFLHGIEGDNEAQNLFFATQGQQAIVYNRRDAGGEPKYPKLSPVRVPKYRGMMWVICEDDLENPEKDLRVLVHRPSNLSSYASSDQYDSESYFDDEDELDDDDDDSSSESFGEPISPDSMTPYTKEPLVRPVSPSQMDLDIQFNDNGDDVHDPSMHHGPGVVEIVGVGTDEKHMHPVQHRPPLANGHALPLPSPIRTTDLNSHHQSRSANITASSETSSSITDSITEPSTASTDYDDFEKPSHTSSFLPPATSNQFTSQRPSSPPPRLHHHKHASGVSRKAASPPPILTSTFRACDLLRRVPGPETSVGSKFLTEEMRSGSSGANNGASPDHDQSGQQEDVDDDGEWEFVPLHVPDGISLRNFGIQVPILASVSDIIVYSPNSAGAAKSANALRLAKRFQQAVDRKRKERVGREEGATLAASSTSLESASADSADVDRSKTAAVPVSSDDSKTPLKYSVFLLDATAEEIRREMPHLVVKLCPEGEVPGSLGAALAGTAKANFDIRDEDGDVDMDGSITSLPLAISPSPQSPSSRSVMRPTPRTRTPPNTVDFAQRERDEMRDLTRATEIVSVFPKDHKLDKFNPDPLHPLAHIQPSSHHVIVRLDEKDAQAQNAPLEEEIDLSTTKSFWDPTVGQIFLGNANDVPLPISGVGEFGERDQRWDGHDSVEPDVYPPGNSPFDAHGYDICIECHDLAPFPTMAHIKASEEKIASLEERWKDVVERARRENGEPEETCTLPPRPPPHPNSIIHLPMPSSPPVTAATMSALMPVVRFLQKCLVPTDAVEIVYETQQPVSRTMEMTMQMSDGSNANGGADHSATENKSRRWSSVSSLIPSFPGFPMHSTPAPPPLPNPAPTTSASRHRSFTSPIQAPSTTHARHHSATSSSHTRHSSLSYLASSSHVTPFPWTRPLKILLYSSDGYTESSVPALCLLMAMKGLSLPKAYLELQVAKRRSFFVYQTDLGVLRKVEGFMEEERRIMREEKQKEERRERMEKERRERMKSSKEHAQSNGVHEGASSSLFGVSGGFGFGFGTHMNPYRSWAGGDSSSSSAVDKQAESSDSSSKQQRHGTRPTAKSVSFAKSPFPSGGSDSETEGSSASQSPSDLGHMGMGGIRGSATLPMSSSVPLHSMSSLDGSETGGGMAVAGRGRRPRASTSPWLPSLFGGDHQSWFNDPRFDGSFPSRVLPFLYLGNLAHASNVYMLQALGITHVVSVGECALVPPSAQNHCNNPHYGNNSPSGHFVPSKSPHQGSLWIEERAGRIKVLDIQGICDDGIDTLEPQLEPICDWIDQARQEGGQVLVHCRVGVSRSATVTIAYVMKHLSLPLVDAYLIVRSRRLSVLIQPNMRLLYNLLGWEIKLAKDRAGDDEEKLIKELPCALSWPYLAKEVHALNEKYLR